MKLKGFGVWGLGFGVWGLGFGGTPEEFEIMKQHATIGYEILRDSVSPLLRCAAALALAHHEKFDGSGYPQGLAGTAIPLHGRIVAVADVFDALTSERPYKKAWTLEAAVDFLKANAGSHFDPALRRGLPRRPGRRRSRSATRYRDAADHSAAVGLAHFLTAMLDPSPVRRTQGQRQPPLAQGCRAQGDRAVPARQRHAAGNHPGPADRPGDGRPHPQAGQLGGLRPSPTRRGPDSRRPDVDRHPGRKRQVVLAFSLVSGNRDGHCPGFDYELFWSRSAATGVATQLLGAATRAAPPAETVHRRPARPMSGAWRWRRCTPNATAS
jgi:hypothetical protein